MRRDTIEHGSAGRGASGTAPRRVLLEAQDRFISAWGQMGATWGISRTMAEIHALLFITGESLCTDDVMERLHISRGNASMSLRALCDWGIVTRAHRRGDRKEYFEAEQDAWSILQKVVRERIKREINPLLALLYEIRELTGVPGETERAREADTAVSAHNTRMDAMLQLLRVTDELGNKFTAASGEQVRRTADMLAGLEDA
ncbi:MAG: transcriptional regulator [Phycisphaerae bacterium]|nr:transcriptional regulator [Phycisphaerae bacterium]